MTKRPPNILYLHAHDLGRCVQPYGYPVQTPALQRLAEEGVLYRNAHCSNPTCSPSRASLLTGQYAHSSGMMGLAHRGFRLNDYGHHLANQLRPAGYVSALAGTQHIAIDPAVIGYDHILTTADDFDAPVAAVETFLEDAPEAPFFLSVGFFAPHRNDDGSFPAILPPPDPRFLRPPSPVPDTPESRADFAAFVASAQSLDHSYGRVLEALERAGLAEQTLVIATTDHGIAFPGMKCNLTDHGTGVMLILRGPGGFGGGAVLESLVSHVDIAPTLMELAGLPVPGHMQGQPLPRPARPEVPERESVFTEINFHAAEEPSRAVRTARWKYIRRFHDQTQVALPNCDEGPTKDLWLMHGWTERGYAAEQLFDLVFDPAEANNLAADEAYCQVLEEMRARLASWMQRTDDPLLAGPLRPPAGARITDYFARTPKGN